MISRKCVRKKSRGRAYLPFSYVLTAWAYSSSLIGPISISAGHNFVYYLRTMIIIIGPSKLCLSPANTDWSLFVNTRERFWKLSLLKRFQKVLVNSSISEGMMAESGREAQYCIFPSRSMYQGRRIGRHAYLGAHGFQAREGLRNSRMICSLSSAWSGSRWWPAYDLMISQFARVLPNKLLDASGAGQEEQPNQIERQQARRQRCSEFRPAASALNKPCKKQGVRMSEGVKAAWARATSLDSTWRSISSMVPPPRPSSSRSSCLWWWRAALTSSDGPAGASDDGGEWQQFVSRTEFAMELLARPGSPRPETERKLRGDWTVDGCQLLDLHGRPTGHQPWQQQLLVSRACLLYDRACAVALDPSQSRHWWCPSAIISDPSLPNLT
jgi:hypothetical protein